MLNLNEVNSLKKGVFNSNIDYVLLNLVNNASRSNYSSILVNLMYEVGLTGVNFKKSTNELDLISNIYDLKIEEVGVLYKIIIESSLVILNECFNRLSIDNKFKYHYYTVLDCKYKGLRELTQKDKHSINYINHKLKLKFNYDCKFEELYFVDFNLYKKVFKSRLYFLNSKLNANQLIKYYSFTCKSYNLNESYSDNKFNTYIDNIKNEHYELLLNYINERFNDNELIDKYNSLLNYLITSEVLS